MIGLRLALGLCLTAQALRADLADSGRTLTLAVGQDLELLLPCIPDGAWWSVADRPAGLSQQGLPGDLVLGRHKWQRFRFAAREPGRGRLRLLLAEGSQRVTREFVLELEVPRPAGWVAPVVRESERPAVPPQRGLPPCW